VSSACLLAVVYDDAATAGRALAALSGLADEHALALEDAAVVVRNEDGVELHQEHSLAGGEGVVGGGTVGLILGLALGIPIAGAIVGIAGGVGAAAIDTGIPDDELRRIGKTLVPGRAAMLALVKHGDWTRIGAALEPYGGEVLVSEVPADIATALGR
jgi:uncharacterized membrane protein